MRFFIIFSFISTILFASNINDSLLKVHATLVPKIPLMDYKFQKKCSKHNIKIVLLYDKINYKDALSLKSKIDIKYNNGIKAYNVAVSLVEYKNLNEDTVNIYYLLPTTKTQHIKEVVKIAKKNNSLTFSYLKDYLKYDIMFSINIGSKIKPVINLDAIRRCGVTFRPILLKISKIYQKGV